MSASGGLQGGPASRLLVAVLVPVARRGWPETRLSGGHEHRGSPRRPSNRPSGAGARTDAHGRSISPCRAVGCGAGVTALQTEKRVSPHRLDPYIAALRT